MKTSPTYPRYVSLDHWRGVAALAVVVFHAFHPWYSQPPAGFGWLTAIAEQGYRGVHLFFVISGYCITHLVVRDYHGRRDVTDFLRQRCLRIVPPYWGACLAAAGIALCSLPFNHGSLFASSAGLGALPASLGSFFSHAFLLDAWLDRGSYLVVAWTLSWEFFYYLLAACALLLSLRFGRAAGLTFAFVFAVAGTVPRIASALPPLTGWTEFFCGACIFFAVEARQAGRSPYPWLAAVLGFGAIGLFLAGPFGNLSVAAAFALTLFVLHRHDARLTSARGLVWLGRVGAMSYSLYLIHVPVASPINNLLSRFIPPGSPGYIFSIALAIAASLAAAWLFFVGLETPVENWRRSLGRRTPVAPLPSSP